MKVTKRATIIWGILLVLVLALAGMLLWMQQTPPSPVPPVPKVAPAKKQATPAKAGKADKDAAATPVGTDAETVGVPIVAGNLGRITELRALEEELTLEAKIAKLRKEKEEAERKGLPVPTLSLPSLTPPPASSAPAPAMPRPVGSGGLLVISVQGVGGQLSATIRTSSGQVVVRKGSRVGEAVVTGISRQGVTVSRSGKTSTLPFE